MGAERTAEFGRSWPEAARQVLALHGRKRTIAEQCKGATFHLMFLSDRSFCLTGSAKYVASVCARIDLDQWRPLRHRAQFAGGLADRLKK